MKKTIAVLMTVLILFSLFQGALKENARMYMKGLI